MYTAACCGLSNGTGKANTPKPKYGCGKCLMPPRYRSSKAHLLERMLKLNTMSTYLRMLRAVYNRALLAGLTGYVPGLFKHVYTGTRADVKRALLPRRNGTDP
ncbi:hypothetical protein NXX20_14605 [Bacteroides stercoris]|nr:hypothetical protein [Bacteroides stercoris]